MMSGILLLIGIWLSGSGVLAVYTARRLARRAAEDMAQAMALRDQARTPQAQPLGGRRRRPASSTDQRAIGHLRHMAG